MVTKATIDIAEKISSYFAYATSTLYRNDGKNFDSKASIDSRSWFFVVLLKNQRDYIGSGWYADDVIFADPFL